MQKFNDSIEQRLTARHKKCFEFCGSVQNKDILDIGSSFGWFEKMALAANCRSVTGLEPREEDFYQAKLEAPAAKFKVGTATHLPFPDNSFDQVVMFDVIEHIPKNTEPAAIREIHRVLRPNGEFILSTPYWYWLSNIMDPAWWLIGHRHYCVENMVQMLTASGFKINMVQKRGRHFELLSAILLYIFKWLFRREIPFKSWFEAKRVSEYLTDREGFETLYVKSSK